MLLNNVAPGTGKTTTASAVAKKSDLEKSVHMHTDDFYHYLSKGAIPPHLPESNEQNLIVIEAFLEAAKRYARGGYDVIVDGIIGPWFLKPWQSLVREHYEVHYIILRASKEETNLDIHNFTCHSISKNTVMFYQEHGRGKLRYELFNLHT